VASAGPQTAASMPITAIQRFMLLL